jgi:RNA-binding protein YhbY
LKKWRRRQGSIKLKMVKTGIITINMGKRGLTPGFIEILEKAFINHEFLKIAVLKSACRDREEIKTMAETICKDLKTKLNKEFTSRIIGFTINIKKWRKLK